MSSTIVIDHSPAARTVVGDMMRFEALDARGQLFVDIDLVAWTLLRDHNPDVRAATKAVEALTAGGSWRSVGGARSLIVSLGSLIVEGYGPE